MDGENIEGEAIFVRDEILNNSKDTHHPLRKLFAKKYTPSFCIVWLFILSSIVFGIVAAFWH
jgi:hypothetical protein